MMTPSREDMNKEELGKQTLLRGTFEWAPSRSQIIFTLHPSSRRQLMEKQNYRCAGCGIEVSQKYASKSRHCEYLGRYSCTVSHSRRSSTIPSRVLTKWNFSKYPVSDFSYRLLDQLSTDPLFNVMNLNPSLYQRARDLQKIRLLRVALFYLKDFIFTCQYAEKLQNVIKLEQNHIYTDPDCYCLKDFINVKNNRLYKKFIRNPVYDRIIDLKIATPQIIVNYASFLEDNKYFSLEFQVNMMSAQMLAATSNVSGTVSDLAPGAKDGMRMLEAKATEVSANSVTITSLSLMVTMIIQDWDRENSLSHRREDADDWK
ncbi:hypothetical protein PGB90_002456 [Kerria lacca]